jgi:hypothetical protein
MIELVDYNEVYGKGISPDTTETAKRTRRGRTKKGGEGTATAATATTPEVTTAADLPAATDANADETVINNNPQEKAAE